MSCVLNAGLFGFLSIFSPFLFLLVDLGLNALFCTFVVFRNFNGVVIRVAKDCNFDALILGSYVCTDG